MSWGWKLATSPDDVLNFLNGVGAYGTPVSAARICAMWKGNHAEFYVFYQRHRSAAPGRGWGWKLATDPEDVRCFLNGFGVLPATTFGRTTDQHANTVLLFSHQCACRPTSLANEAVT